ncbi:MAG: cell division ATP-binding protein FtsE [Lachnospiraceae bacterium]|nr:cell division ATP-binding protein FtsE [Lachnospiraceae bacterium]
MIEFSHVHKIYNEETTSHALKDINLKIEDGEFVFIIGDSGSGKSTLIRLILGEEKPTSGTITVDGIDVAKLPSRKLPQYRRHFGVIFQDFRLLKDYSVYENIAYAQRIVSASPKAMHRRIPKLLAMIGLEEKAKSYPPQLSGGEQQRVAIARAVVNGPFYLLADEPTGNLDPANSEEVINLLQRFNSTGTTVIMVTHDAQMVNRFRKRVITMHDGEIVRDIQEGGYDNA